MNKKPTAGEYSLDDSFFLRDVQARKGEHPAFPGRKGTILYSILAALLLVGLTPLFGLSWRLISTNKDVLRSNQKEIQNQIGNSINESVHGFILNHHRILLNISDTLGILVRAAGVDPVVLEIKEGGILPNYLDENVLSVDLYTAGERIGSQKTFVSLTSEIAGLLDEAARQGLERREYLSPPVFAGFQPEPLMVLARPVIHEGAVLGVLSILLSLQEIQETLLEEGGSAYHIFLVDEQDRIFASSASGRIGGEIDNPGHPLIQLYQQNRFSSTTVTYTLSRDEATREMLGTYIPIQDLSWGTFVEMEAREAFYTVADMKRETVISAVVAAILALAIGLGYAQRITRPIKVLARSTEKITDRDFSVRVKVGSRNELGQLAHTFNVMTHEIEEYVDRIKYASKVNHELFIGMVRMLARAIDAKDPYTKGHSERVHIYSMILAKEMGVNSQTYRDVYIGSLLHDVGKIGIEDKILQKPAALTDAEYKIMKAHPVYGDQILAPVTHLAGALSAVRNHHERYDGTGYPDALTGDAIPLVARIVTVADTFDAMTTNRPYQDAMTLQVTIDKIQSFAGKACDPKVVGALVRAYHKGVFDQVGQVRKQSIRA